MKLKDVILDETILKQNSTLILDNVVRGGKIHCVSGIHKP